MIVEKEAKTYIQHKFCECGAELVYDPRSGALCSNPPQYQHDCPNEDCATPYHRLRVRYPNTIVREIEG